MKFGLSIDITVEIQNKATIIQHLSDSLENHFNKKNYGHGIKSYTIGVVCISPNFDQFFKKTNPKYTKGKKETIQHGIPFTLEDSLEYNIKLDFESFKNSDELKAKKILATEILQSLVVFDKMKSKIKDFDVEKFKAELIDYFESNNLI